MAEIQFKKGPKDGQHLTLKPPTVTIGRRPTLDIVLEDGAVSSHHAELRFENEVWHIVDVGSSNGTLLNNRDVKSSRLADGDVVQIGASIITFRGDLQVCILHDVTRNDQSRYQTCAEHLRVATEPDVAIY